MTVFTKAEEKKEPIKDATPQVVVTDPVETHNEIMKQSRQETHDEYFTRAKRSSSFGPLSIVRLTPSPLCRTPSPPRSYSPHEREHRRLSRHFNIAAFIALLVFSFILGFSYRAYLHSSVNYHLRRIFRSSPSTLDDSPPPLVFPPSAQQSLPLVASSSPQTEVRSLDGRPISAVFVHDYKKGLTAILDITNQRCFVKKISHMPKKLRMVTLPSLRQSMQMPLQEPMNSSMVVNQYFKVERRLRDRDINRMNSFVVYRHCAGRPSFLLSKGEESIVSTETRVKRDAESVEMVEVVEGITFIDHIHF